jgi:YVTN family beta-propeller protein
MQDMALRRRFIRLAIVLAAMTLAGWQARRAPVTMGRQADGRFVVSSGQRIDPGTIAFDGRPIDLALHPAGDFFAVLGQNRVFLARPDGVLTGASLPLGAGAGFHGCRFNPAGDRLYVSVSNGTVLECLVGDGTLTEGRRLRFGDGNPRPGGMAITRDGTTLFVALMDRDAVAQVELATGRVVRTIPVEKLPFTVALSADEKTLLVSNWGGRPPKSADRTAQSAGVALVTDARGIIATGTVSLIDRASGAVVTRPVGNHPTAIAVDGGRAYIANSASDSISVVDIARRQVSATWSLRRADGLLGTMPTALAVAKDALLVACGGDNALAELDTRTGLVRGFRPAGYYPVAVALSADGRTALVCNTKGNGSVRNTVLGKPGNAHDFQGTVSVIDRTRDLKAETARVRDLSGDTTAATVPKLAVFQGAIKHVLYIIKENRTYDEVFGDLPQGNGDLSLCGLGEEVTPNHHALARAFTLFDNGYVSGTNSADGHQWTDAAAANDYLERFYTGYRTYPDDGDDPMGLTESGYLWDAALKKKKRVRVYGEMCDDAKATFTPNPKDWLEMYRDRGVGRITARAQTTIASLKPLIHPNYIYWPLIQSDQARADLFIDEVQRFSRAGTVPDLMVLSLPCDHTEGTDPLYPKPRSMVADNDRALGRIVEAVSRLPEWKSTAIFVIEDDAQAGPDHVDGHRTVFACYSPYVRRGFVDSSFYTTVSMLRTIELMLGLDPMNRFDARTAPLVACFTDTPDPTAFRSVPNRVPLDDMNPPRAALAPKEQRWFDRSAALDWSGIDRADFGELNRIVWHSLHGDRPYPSTR